MMANIPAAILVERHGRKPYLVHSFWLLAGSVGFMGLPNQSMEGLILCRLATGTGVAALSTAATMTIADLSTPRNRASTMAPTMSAFAAGTALGPAIGGYLGDLLGVHATFYAVGLSYLGLGLLNHHLQKETQPRRTIDNIDFPWNAPSDRKYTNDAEQKTVMASAQEAVNQWSPLMKNPTVRNVTIMMDFIGYTDSDGMNMSPISMGQVYMGMSMVQVLGNPLMAKFVDANLKKGRAVLLGCSLLSLSMAALPYCHYEDHISLPATLGLWSLGSTILSTAPVAQVTQVVPEEKRAQALALLRTCGDLGFFMGATSIGAMADWTGNLHISMQASAGILLTATAWFGMRQAVEASLTNKSTTS
eukprot:CAMPEP_0118723728 /NCGR_PEP_ID=MMETSP0800-20121206/32165_1 /TAXON_ID=210618 ORGANISM="Striatella unipunctata, Strain CCMP2910" /NCGR_SAMPLE_ID=MMETSP0800 /ASSEMBLY_ACC=CAM_ASM_000638 /LENGTH=361 /DNA_ID=CAMNT_0006632187 /DNA_START=205 /DNA_END=1291 /DNA_ORIENTATION=+